MSKLKKQFISNIPYYVLFFILLFIHIQLNVSTGDDVNFAIRAKSMTFTDFNIYKYYNWSSRQLIESVLYFISVHSHVWMLLNSLVITIIAKLIEAIEIVCQALREDKDYYKDWESKLTECIYEEICMNPAYYMDENNWKQISNGAAHNFLKLLKI